MKQICALLDISHCVFYNGLKMKRRFIGFQHTPFLLKSRMREFRLLEMCPAAVSIDLGITLWCVFFVVFICSFIRSSILHSFLSFQELDIVKKLGLRCFRDIQADETNILLWKGLLMPVSSKKLDENN